jgi:hypothetical protein
MKTINMTRMAMALIFLMALSLSGCAQHTTAGGMDTSMEGSMNEMTEQKMTDQHMDSTMDTMAKDTMHEMDEKHMGDTMDTMKHDTMQDEMDKTEDRMMQDSGKEMMQ